MRSKGLWAFAVVGVLVLAISAVYATPQQLVLEVRVGEKGERGDTRAGEQHSITLDALREGKTKFWVEGKDDQMFLVDLTLPPEEIRSFAQGTALMVDAVPATKAEGDNDSAIDGWVVKTGAEVSMIVTLQLKQQGARVESTQGGLPAGSSGGGGGGGW